jgi:hypothetical protein
MASSKKRCFQQNKRELYWEKNLEKNSIMISHLSQNKNFYIIEKFIAQKGETWNDIGCKIGYEIRIKKAKLDQV